MSFDLVEIAVVEPAYRKLTVEEVLLCYEDCSLSEEFDIAETVQSILDQISYENYNKTKAQIIELMEFSDIVRNVVHGYLYVKTDLFAQKRPLLDRLEQELGIEYEWEPIRICYDSLYVWNLSQVIPEELFEGITRDDLQKVQNYVSNCQTFDYEKKFVMPGEENHYEPYITYLTICAAFGAVKCFKYFYLNGAQANMTTVREAFKGGNLEIIHFLENMFEGFDADQLIPLARIAILFHHNDVLRWLIEKDPSHYWCVVEFDEAIKSHNFTAFKMLLLLHGGQIETSAQNMSITYENDPVTNLIEELNHDYIL